MIEGAVVIYILRFSLIEHFTSGHFPISVLFFRSLFGPAFFGSFPLPWPEVHQTQRRGPLRSARRERRRGTTGGSHEEDHGAGGYRGEGMGSMEPGDGSR